MYAKCIIIVRVVHRMDKIDVIFMSLDKFKIEDSDIKAIEKKKLLEEVGEFLYPRDKKNLLEEFNDVIQVCFNILYAEGITKEEIVKSQQLHKDKLISRGHNFL